MLNIFLLFLISISNPVTTPSPPVFGVGGPDAYGYRWIDSDTTAPGAPVYNWIDITGIGDTIRGLADDNVVGPFPIGFDFPYYWYTVNSFFVGSNGYIAFGDNFLSAHPFQNFPNAARPNNTLAPLMCDLDFSAGSPLCMYWTNNRDTCIISYINVPFWNTGGSNTFQIILTKADSSIYFQYQTQNGAPYNGWQSTGSSTIGIENITGRVGLSYMHAGQPTYNMPHASLAIKFYPPPTTGYQVRDIAAWAVMNDNSEGVFVHLGDTVFPRGKVKNAGNVPTGSFPVYCRIRSGANVVFAETIQVASSNPGEVININCTRRYVPTATGLYTMVIRSALSGDSVPSNDSLVLEMRVVQYPGELRWEDLSTPRAMYYWNGPGGYGNKFYPPRYPASVTQAKVYASGSNTPVSVLVLDDNGPNGAPGDTLFITTINISTQQWYTVNVTPPVNIASGAFYVGCISAVSMAPSFGMDTLPPVSRLGWEYTNSWAPSRHAAQHDIMIRAVCDVGSGIKEIVGEKEISLPPTIMRIKEFISKPKSQIYNACGLPMKNEKLTTGIYFLKEEGKIRKLILVE
ncbi:MAG: hypothetical protein ABIK84_00205 [candidate division WOR-3 bacterium]